MIRMIECWYVALVGICVFLAHGACITGEVLSSEDTTVFAKLTLWPGGGMPVDYLTIYNSGQVKAVVKQNDAVKEYSARIDKSELDALKDAFRASGITDDKLSSMRTYVGPDMPSWKIQVNLEGKSYALESAHPFFEDNPSLVVTQEGVHALQGKEDKESYYETHASPEYKYFIEVWNKSFSQFESLYKQVTGKELKVS